MAESVKASFPSSPHAILVCFPHQGHINPTLELASRLVAQDVSVTFVNFENVISQIKSLPTAQSHQINFVGLPDGLPFDHPRLPGSVEFFEAAQRMVEVFEQFIAKLVKDAVPISCVISDTFMPWTQGVSLKFSIPRILLWTSSAASLSVFFHGHLLVSKGVIPDPDAQCSASGELKPIPADEVIDYIPGVPVLLPADIPAVLNYGDWRSRFLLKSSQQIEDAKWVLAHSLHELEKETFEELKEVIPFLPIGPLFAERSGDDGGDKDDCLSWLDDREKASVLYIALGSIYEATREEVEEIAAALEESPVPFLWSIRGKATKDVALDGFMKRTKGKGLLVSWAPQKKVLAHPSIAGFLSHCGWNSTLESLWCGVPLIAWPRDSEQHVNSKFVVDCWHVGIRLPPLIDRNEICRAINTLMFGEASARIHANANALSFSCSNATSSNLNLQMLVKALSHPPFAKKR